MNKHIRLLTPHVSPRPNKLTELEGLERADLKFSHALLDAGPVSIESEYDSALAAPYVVGRIIEAENEGVDAIMIDCMGDPGLYPAREAVSIPVFGPCETSMHVAGMLGHRFSVLCTKNRRIPIFELRAKQYGVADKMVSARAIEVDVLGINHDLDGIQEKLTKAAVTCITDDNADVIILGCTGFLGMSEAIEDNLKALGFDVPVINPIRTTMMVAASFVDVGLSHSGLAFPAPPKKPVHGYALPDIKYKPLVMAAE